MRVDEPDVRGLVAGGVDAERRVVELPGDVLCRADGASALVVGEEVGGGLDDVGGEAVGEVAVRPGLPNEGDDGVLKVDTVELVVAAGGGVEVVVEAVGHEEDVVFHGCLGFTVRVGSEEGPSSPDQWVRGK